MYGKLKVTLLCLFLCSCQYSTSAQNQEPLTNKGQYEQKVIYGDDDRLDIYELLDPTWLMIAGSTVALIDNSKMTQKSDGYDISSRDFGSSLSLCADEPFYEQKTAAFCSGSLIGPDTIVTAGHCIQNINECQRTSFVFDFGYLSEDHNPSHVDSDDVYECAELIHSEVDGFEGSDYALIRLNRPVVGRDPLPVRNVGQAEEGDELVVIGHPSGLPTKIAGGASIRENDKADFFVANLDTYGGNSGSAVFNAVTQEVEGILVRGDTDYVYQNGCRRSNVCPQDGCRGEDVTRITNIFDQITVDDLENQVPIADERN
jgi:hypothetical protein